MPKPPYVVLWHPLAEEELNDISDESGRAAVRHAAEQLEAIGSLMWPHSSAVKGSAGKGLRELRPRGGRSRWRPLYRQVGSANRFVILPL